jgi:exopolyphosphatase/guanosine-5'-triphosphate,3'-diphosphate pyrophosphatase
MSELSGIEAAANRPTVAAVDLGSNSFHMIIARSLVHDIHVLDRIRDPVRLADGLDRDGKISDDAQERALASLERFGERIREIPRAYVRVVGTNTLRRARNAREFRAKAQKVLGHPIEVISGQEEARLIYLGVAHSHSYDATHRLVVDIGGGSTEIIIGEGFEILRSHSMYMGCVTYTREYFPEGVLTRERFRAAETAAGLELRSIETQLRGVGWQVAVGASGTINAISDMLRASDSSTGEITLSAMKKIRKACIAAERISKLDLPGLKPDRAAVLPGGLAILIAVFNRLGIESMAPSPGALREGLLYEIVGRMRHEDVRDRTIRRLVDQYDVDLAQAARVERTALQLLQHLREAWSLDFDSSAKLLAWASRLHEIGLAVSYTGYHKHGAYLASHSDMPGFSRDDQQMLAALIALHRRKIAKETFAEMSPPAAETALRLGVILRLAVLLNRSRIPETTPQAKSSSSGRAIELVFPPEWLASHPLTIADLEQESALLKSVGFELGMREASLDPSAAQNPAGTT